MCPPMAFAITYTETCMIRAPLEILLSDLTLSPVLATTVFVIACWAGYRYRTVWKADGPAWTLWIYGLVAGTCLLALGFIPVVEG